MSSFPSLQPSAKCTLVSAVEDHLTNVIASAVSVSRKCKRARLLYRGGTTLLTGTSGGGGGGGIDAHKIHTRLQASDIHLALQMRGSPRLFGHSNKVSSGVIKETSIVRLKDVVDPVETLLEPPTEIATHHTWLVVDGEAVDPSIPIISISAEHAHNSTTTNTGMASTVSPTVALADDSASNVQIDRMIQSGVLSEELKLYYQRITTALEEPVISNLTVTTGIQEIVPFLVRFAVEKLYETLATGQNEELARTMIRILQSLLLNVSLHLDLQLHQIVPALVTAGVAELSDHFRCKLDTASTLALIVRLYGDSYPDLAPRIISVLAQALLMDPFDYAEKAANSPPVGRVLGALLGLTALGAIEGFGHIVAQAWEQWDQESQQVALTAAIKSLEVRRVLGDRCVVHDTTETNGYAHCFV